MERSLGIVLNDYSSLSESQGVCIASLCEDFIQVSHCLHPPKVVPSYQYSASSGTSNIPFNKSSGNFCYRDILLCPWILHLQIQWIKVENIGKTKSHLYMTNGFLAISSLNNIV
jgi:hypothetical protein